jgi:light-regulated signal transduction histidine kinase (bacteriophytochrome)
MKQIVKDKIDLDKLVQSIVSEQKTVIKNQNVQVDINPLGFALADSALIRQVWINLISNALKYSSKKDKPQVTIGCEKINNENIFYVKDNGVGFDMHYAGKLFQVFQRLHKQEEFTGTGVGLALVKRIIDKHGGRIWAESKLNEGTTFYFSLS